MLSDPVILLWEISTKVEDENVKTLYTKRLSFQKRKRMDLRKCLHVQ